MVRPYARTHPRRPRLWVIGLFIVLLSFIGAAAQEPDGQQPAPRPNPPARAARKGQWIRVPLPIDHAGVSRVKQTIQRALGAADGIRPVFVLQFDPPAGEAEAGGGTQFEDAYKLAKLLVSDELNGATTVAYVPKSIRGHAVLVALACDQIIMAPAALLGDAGIDEKVVDNTMITAYQEIARARHTVPTEVAMALLDKSRQIVRVRTDVDTQYVTPAQLNELGRQRTIVSQEQIKAAGESWQFSGAEGRKWGFVSFLTEDPRDVVRALELSSDVIVGDPAAAGGWRAVRIDLKGTITADKVSQVQRLIDEQVRGDVNMICLWIESPGGSPVDCKDLADYLAGLDRTRILTVAYIPTEARADAAIIAMACDQVVMHPRAILGGPGAYQMSNVEAGEFRRTLRDSLSRQKMRSWSLWAAMIDRNLEVFRCTRLGQVEYFSDDELRSQQPRVELGEKGPPWEKREAVTTPGRELRLHGDQAKEFRLANAVVDDFGRFREHFGLENDPTLLEPGWADRMAMFLRTTEIAVLLLVLGGLGLYIELHLPGLGIGGFIATVSFALFFWSRYLDGTAGWLNVTLFLTGLVCVLLEVFVIPGLGIFGLGGGAMILLSLILASETTLLPRNEYQLAQLERSLLIVVAAGGGLIVATLVIRRWLPRARLMQHVFLNPPEGEEAATISRREMLVNLENLVGATGVTTTPLTPGGKARFGNHLADVIGDDFVPRDTPVIVTEVHGNRVLVRVVEG